MLIVVVNKQKLQGGKNAGHRPVSRQFKTVYFCDNHILSTFIMIKFIICCYRQHTKRCWSKKKKEIDDKLLLSMFFCFVLWIINNVNITYALSQVNIRPWEAFVLSLSWRDGPGLLGPLPCICLSLTILFTEFQLSNQIDINVTTVDHVLSGHFVIKILNYSGRNKKVQMANVTVSCKQWSSVIFVLVSKIISSKHRRPHRFSFLWIVIVTVFFSITLSVFSV